MPKMRAADEGDRVTSSIEADRTRRRCVAAAACWAAGGGASAQAPELLLRTASQAGIAIKFNLNRPGPPGFCVELVRWLEKNDPGLRFTGLQRELPLARAILELRDRQIDVFFSLIDSPKRLRQVDFLDTPVLYESRHQVAVRREEPARPGNYAELREASRPDGVLITHGTVYAEALQQVGGFKLQALASSNRQNLEMLLRGRARVFYHAGSTLRAEIAAAGLSDRLVVLNTVFQVQKQRVAFAPGLAPEARARVARGMAALDARGVLADLRARYGLD